MEMMMWLPSLYGFMGVVIGACVGYAILYLLERLRNAQAGRDARTLLEDARKESEHMIKEAKVHARDEVIRAREAFEDEVRSRRQELVAQEERLSQREANLDRKVAMLDKKDAQLEQKIQDLETRRAELDRRHEDLEALMTEERATIQRVAGLSQDEARKSLLQKLDEELRFEYGALIRRYQDEARLKAEKEARDIIVSAIERYAAEQVSEVTTSTVNLPNDEMKGRIIGREGRNIRALEAETGVNFLIDDTPEVIVISGFDPLRREIARLALERLMADGRIHPGRIEEVVTKVRGEVEETIRRAGEDAIYELGLQHVAPELVRTLGRLKFRHSYNQNVLTHSVEMAHLMAMMAGELGLDPVIAKRVGLFHDIGKAIDHQVEGGHALIGADLLKRHGEAPIVFNAVAAHHGEVQAESIYANLATAADAITAARPGARAETTELYLKRLEKLEGIANSYRGVARSYAMQAGREVRVYVDPGKIDDHEAMQMARNISKQIEQELQYPGQIKVVVVRETRCIEFAR